MRHGSACSTALTALRREVEGTTSDVPRPVLPTRETTMRKGHPSTRNATLTKARTLLVLAGVLTVHGYVPAAPPKGSRPDDAPGGAKRTLKAPFRGDAVLDLQR